MSLHSSPETAPSPAIDPQVFSRLRELQDEDDPTIVSDIVGLFLSGSPPRMEHLVGAVARGDTRGIETASHDLKSSGANLGATRFAEISKDLERMGRTGTIQYAPAALALLQQEHVRVTRELEAILLDESRRRNP